MALLALATADDFANSGKEDVHGAHGRAVFVEAHVKGFDRRGVIKQYHRRLKVLLDQVTLVLRLQVGAPGLNGVGKLTLLVGLRSLENLNSLGVAAAHKGVALYEFKLLDEAHGLALGKGLGLFFLLEALVQQQ